MTTKRQGEDRDLEAVVDVAQDLGRVLKAHAPNGYVFFLCVADIGPEGGMAYVSTIDRSDALRLLEELADKMARELRS